MIDSESFLSGANASYIFDLFQQYQVDGSVLSADWRQFFDALTDEDKLTLIEDDRPPQWAPIKNGHAVSSQDGPQIGTETLSQAASSAEMLQNSIRALMFIRSYRVRGHLNAQLDPLGLEKRDDHPELLPQTYGFTPEDMKRYESKIEVMNYFELKNYIEREKIKGSSRIEFFEVEQYKRSSFPFATFILTVIGVSISSRKVRGGVGLQIALGMLLSCFYIMLMYIFTTIATAGSASPFLAVWTPNIIFSFVAFYFYKTAQQ